MIPTHFFQDLGGLPATLAKPPLFADLGLVLGIPTEGFLPVPVRSLPRPAIRNGPGKVRLGRIWLLNGAVGTRPLIVQELFSRMVGQALPHEGVDSSRCYPAAWQRALVSLFVQRCKCTKPPHRGRGSRPIPVGSLPCTLVNSRASVLPMCGRSDGWRSVVGPAEGWGFPPAQSLVTTDPARQLPVRDEIVMS